MRTCLGSLFDCIQRPWHVVLSTMYADVLWQEVLAEMLSMYVLQDTICFGETLRGKILITSLKE